MEKFATYLAAYDGTNSWDEIQPLFDGLFHPDCVFVTAQGEMNKTQWARMAQGLAEKGAIASDFAVTRQEGDAFYYEVTITVGEDAPLHLTSKGTLRDGRIARVEPVEPAAYSEMIARSR